MTRWWQTRRRAAEAHARTCEDALVSLLEFVTDELDPEPAPWPAYFTRPRHVALAAALQEREHRTLRAVDATEATA